MRCILVILDGLGDRGCAVFGGRTPLQAAHTQNLDHLARIGMNGLVHCTLQGVAMPSETAHFLLFGYDLPDFPGRGVLEAVGEGIPEGAHVLQVISHTRVPALLTRLLGLEGWPVERQVEFYFRPE